MEVQASGLVHVPLGMVKAGIIASSLSIDVE